MIATLVILWPAKAVAAEAAMCGTAVGAVVATTGKTVASIEVEAWRLATLFMDSTIPGMEQTIPFTVVGTAGIAITGKAVPLLPFDL